MSAPTAPSSTATVAHATPPPGGGAPPRPAAAASPAMTTAENNGGRLLRLFPAAVWERLRAISSSRSKVDSSVSSISTHEIKSTNDTSRDQPVATVIPSTTTSNAESNSSFSRLEVELKVSSRLRKFAFNDLKSATRNFRTESLLGEGGFGCVLKLWIHLHSRVGLIVEDHVPSRPS